APVGGGIVELTGHVIERRPESLPHPGVHRAAARVLVDAALHLLTELAVGPRAAREPHRREAIGKLVAEREVVERGNQLPPREVPARAEDHHGARRHPQDALRQLGLLHADAGRHQRSLTAWPPNSARSAAIIRSRNESSWRERKRLSSDSVSSSAGTLRSIASCTVQRPSPESSTQPRMFSSAGSLVNARPASSSSHERTTLPWFQRWQSFAR